MAKGEMLRCWLRTVAWRVIMFATPWRLLRYTRAISRKLIFASRLCDKHNFSAKHVPTVAAAPQDSVSSRIDSKRRVFELRHIIELSPSPHAKLFHQSAAGDIADGRARNDFGQAELIEAKQQNSLRSLECVAFAPLTLRNPPANFNRAGER